MSQPSSPHDELRFLTHQLRDYLQALQAWGVQHVPGDRVPKVGSPVPVLPESAGSANLRSSEASEAQTESTNSSPLPPSSQDPQEALLPADPPTNSLSMLSLPELEA